jgi:hypothetical protein
VKPTLPLALRRTIAIGHLGPVVQQHLLRQKGQVDARPGQCQLRGPIAAVRYLQRLATD